MKKKIFIIAGSLLLLALLVVLYLIVFSSQLSFSNKEKLKSLPYNSYGSSKKLNKKSIVKYDETKAYKALNYYTSGDTPESYLMDMKGDVLHSWKYKVDKDDDLRNQGWFHSILLKNGDIMAVRIDRELIRLNWNSELVWTNKDRFHHDMRIAENGDIFALTRTDQKAGYEGAPEPVIEDFLVILSDSGEIIRKISLYKIFKDFVPQERYKSIREWMKKKKNLKYMKQLKTKFGYWGKPNSPLDVLHVNSVEFVDRDIPNCCSRGDLIVSLREIDTIAVIDVEEEKLLWHWGKGHISRQHHPTMLDNGNILIFDNGRSKGRSRAVEVNPSTKEIVWQYPKFGEKQFFSKTRGSCQRLPNGNTLITASWDGRVFEITPQREVVWDFYNPRIRFHKGKRRRAVIYRMVRLLDPGYNDLFNKLGGISE